jgi:hypothetical protein
MQLLVCSRTWASKQQQQQQQQQQESTPHRKQIYVLNAAPGDR